MISPGHDHDPLLSSSFDKVTILDLLLELSFFLKSGDINAILNTPLTLYRPISELMLEQSLLMSFDQIILVLFKDLADLLWIFIQIPEHLVTMLKFFLSLIYFLEGIPFIPCLYEAFDGVFKRVNCVKDNQREVENNVESTHYNEYPAHLCHKSLV